MPAPEGAPAWASELALAYESGAHGQFLLYGNVHDRMAVGGRLVNLAEYLENELLAGFQVVLTYDLGNGLAVARGGERVEQWGGAELARPPREPLGAVQWVSRYLRYLGNLRVLGRDAPENVALVVRGIDQIAASDGAGYEHGSLTSVLREWASEAPFRELPFTSLLIADNLNDVEPLVAFDPHAARIRVPLPDAPALERALALLRAKHPKAFAPEADLSQLAGALVGVAVSALESLVKIRGHSAQALGSADLTRIKKDLVERDAGGPGRVRRVEAQPRRLLRPGSAQALAPPGRRALAGGRLEGAADGIPLLRPRRDRQDIPGRVPRGRGGRADRQAEELPRALGRLQRGQPREDLPAGPRSRPLHGLHRRGRPGPRPARVGERRQRALGPPLLDGRPGDGGHRKPRARRLDPRLVATGPDRGGPEASGARRREGADPPDEHARPRAPRSSLPLRSATEWGSSPRPSRSSSRACRRCSHPEPRRRSS